MSTPERKRKKKKKKKKEALLRTEELSKLGLKGLVVVFTIQEEDIRLAHVGVEELLSTISLEWLLLLVLLHRIE